MPNLKLKLIFIPVLAPIFIILLIAQDLSGKPETSRTIERTTPVRNIELDNLKKISNATRIIIKTSGPAEFNSYWLDIPPRLLVEFKTRNIISKIDNEIIVKESIIKRITSEYFEEGQGGSLKSLAFELIEKVPYRIWQELDTILLDIETPLEISTFPEKDKEVFAKNETRDVMIKRLETMDAVLAKMSTSPLSLDTLSLEVPEEKIEFSETRRKTMISLTFWFMGLALISGLGLLSWLFCRRYRLILDKNIATQEIARLKLALQEKNKLLEQEEVIRKTIENTSLAREKEFKQLRLELQKEAELLEQEEKVRKTIEEKLSQKEKEYQGTKNSLESLKEVLLEKGYIKKLTSPEEKDAFWIQGESQERRCFPRLDLTRDYNRTIILRIESLDKSISIKSFANNISLEGLCFETRKDFEENQIITLRLFFFGDRVPIIKIKAEIVWKKTVSPVNYYGVFFVSIEEKDKIELNRYIESKIVKS